MAEVAVFRNPAATTTEVVAVAEEAEETTDSAAEAAGAAEDEVAVTDPSMTVRKVTVVQGCSTSGAGPLINHQSLAKRYILSGYMDSTGVFMEVVMVLGRYLEMA